MRNGGRLANSGTLNGGLTNSGTYAQASGTTAGGITNTGTINADGGAFMGAIANDAGTFAVGGAAAGDAGFSNAGGATLAIAAGATDTAGGRVSNAGKLTIAEGGQARGQSVSAAAGREAGKACALSQRQVNQQGQTVLAVGLRPTSEGGASGLMILPFGIAVREGIALKVDGTQVGELLPVSTCLPAGCLVPLALGADAVAALGGGKSGTITAPAAEGAPVELTLSLNGFGGALTRVAELGSRDL